MQLLLTVGCVLNHASATKLDDESERKCRTYVTLCSMLSNLRCDDSLAMQAIQAANTR